LDPGIAWPGDIESRDRGYGQPRCLAPDANRVIEAAETLSACAQIGIFTCIYKLIPSPVRPEKQ
jgi:hypothetical protein